MLYQDPYVFQKLKRAKKKTLGILKTVRDHLANDYRLHSPSCFTDKAVKSGSETHTQEISKNEPDA